jgi:glycosyltransferase involved in cell wall biosynthesis
VQRRRIVHRAINLRQRWLQRRQLSAARYDINLFLEDVSPGFFSFAAVNLFIPNPEWFKENQHRYLPGIDSVLCKTREALDTFSQLGCKVQFIGFTSEDRSDSAHPQQRENTFLHLAGRSWQKGTKPLVELWLRHPQWPTLTVVQNDRMYNQARVAPITAPNIIHRLGRLNDADLHELQNRHTIHLCPSEAEGFGHCIAEAMSCGALTLTTNAPPMNELITPERGVLVDYHRMSRQRSGANYYVDPADLERKIEAIIAMDDHAVRQLGENARQWYLDNDRLFRMRLVEALEQAVPVA